MAIDPAAIKALVFDVFGTVVDWRGSALRELARFGRARQIERDWAAFADDWRGGYAPAMKRVVDGEVPWQTIDVLHRRILDSLLAKYAIAGLGEAEIDHLNRLWHRLDPWPDAVSGLWRLKQRYIIGTLSNGNMALLVDLTRHAALPWDVVFSAELAHSYKPHPSVYRLPVTLLAMEPQEVMLVAAHGNDLTAAASCGLRTAHVSRPLEHGPGRASQVETGSFDFRAGDFNHLADQLGA